MVTPEPAMSAKPGVTRREKGSSLIKVIQLFKYRVRNDHRSVRKKDRHIPRAQYSHNNPNFHEEEPAPVHEGL